MLEVLLFLALAFPCSFAADNVPVSSEPLDRSLQILDTASSVVKEDVFSPGNDAKALLAAKTFKPHVYTVLITEPSRQNPVQGVQDLRKEKIHPFLSPKPNKPKIMKEIQVVYPKEQIIQTSRLLIACATIFTMILFFGSVIMIATLCYVVRLKNTSPSFSVEDGRIFEKQDLFQETEMETVDELSTLTDGSSRILVTNRSGTPDMVIDISEVVPDIAAPGDTPKGPSPVALSPAASSAPPSPPPPLSV